MALKTRLTDDQVATAAARIKAGESWASVSSAYQVDRCDLSRHFRLLDLDYRRRFYKCQPPKLAIPAAVTELAYIAGLFDGEGHIGSQSGRWYLKITNTHRPVIDWLLRLGGSDRTTIRPPHKTRYDWGVHAQQDVLALLEAIFPYLIIKRDLAARVISAIGDHPYRLTLPSTTQDA